MIIFVSLFTKKSIYQQKQKNIKCPKLTDYQYEEFPCWVDSYVWRFGGYAGWEAFCISVYYMGDKKPMKALLID